MTRGGTSAAPISQRVCDAACLGFALWTICCHAVVASNASLRALLALFALALAGLGAAGVRGWRRGGGAGGETDVLGWRLGGRAEGETAADPDAARRSAALRAAQLAGLALGLAAVASIYAWGRVLLLWWWTAALLGVAAAVFLLAEAPRVRAPCRGRRLEAGLWALALGCALLALIGHRPDADDSFYLNVAVAAADAPGRALLDRDTLHGIEGLPIHLAAYRLHAYELGIGAVSYLTGIPAIHVMHWLAAAVAALLVPLAHARLFRRLTPRRWLWTTWALVVVLVAVGETHRWYGNFAFVRSWQGKGIFLFVLQPLIYAYALDFALRPRAAGWLRLAAAQVAGLGCSATAVWAGPVASLVALASVLRPNRSGLARLLVGALASSYVIVAGLLLKSSLEGSSVSGSLPREYAAGVQLLVSLEAVLGDSLLQSVGIGAIAVTWALCGRGLAQRFAIAAPLAVWVVLLDPYAHGWIRANVTGPSTWRAMWSMPIPILLALIAVTPLQLRARPAARWAGRIACLALVAAFAAFVPRYGGLSTSNGGLWLGRPQLKVPEPGYRWASALNGSVPPGATVVAPPYVSTWIPTFHHHAHPLIVRIYLDAHRDRLEEGELDDRRMMTSYTAGVVNHERAPEVFRAGLDRFDVRGVCLRNSEHAGEARAILRANGFRRSMHGIDHEIWVRS